MTGEVGERTTTSWEGGEAAKSKIKEYEKEKKKTANTQPPRGGRFSRRTHAEGQAAGESGGGCHTAELVQQQQHGMGKRRSLVRRHRRQGTLAITRACSLRLQLS
jgi:hypothetical protein